MVQFTVGFKQTSLDEFFDAQIGRLGAALLKLSYVMHLNASKHLGINDFARPGGVAEAGSEPALLECCLAAGKPCV